jgi:adenine-specific DNA-methyltransferase
MPEPAVVAGRDDTDSSRLMEIALHDDLSRWRVQLARSIARHNPDVRSDKIATAVNRFLFSLLLLRIAEDRDLISAGTLTGMANSSLPDLFRSLSPYAEELYGEESTDYPVSPDPMEDPTQYTRVVQDILNRLTASERLYHGSRISTEAISHVLAQYLTRTVRRSASNQAMVVDTDEAVLAGRLDVLPGPLTGYQVRQALQAAGMNRSRLDPLPLRVLDPACGSGTILLETFRYLVTTRGGAPLSYEELREILSGCIYGLDSSRHAVAAARFVLLLGFFENLKATHSLSNSLHIFPDTALSVLRDLHSTIFCGNALIDPTIANEESWMFCPEGLRRSLKPSVYGERFPEIISCGGFDAVICNPPNGPLEQREWIHHYFQRRYAVYHPRVDRSAYFVEKALTVVRPGGIVSSTMSSRWLRGSAGAPLRELISSRMIVAITDLSELPQGSPGAGLSILCLRAAPATHSFPAVTAGAGFLGEPEAYALTHGFPVTSRQLGPGGWTFRDTRREEIIRKVHHASIPLGELVMDQIHPGLTIPGNNPFVIEEEQARQWIKKDPRCKPLLRRFVHASEISRYSVRTSAFLLLIPHGWTISHKDAVLQPWRWMKRRHPVLARHLITFEEQLKTRAPPRTLWWENGCDIFWQEPRRKILFPAQSGSPEFFFDSGRSIGDEATIAIPSSSLFLCGVLNSRLMRFVLEHNVLLHQPGQKCTWNQIRNLPIRTPDFDHPEEVSRHEKMERLVQRMLELGKSCRSAGAISEHENFPRKVHATDAKIDALVYAVYGLTADEIDIVEKKGWRE